MMRERKPCAWPGCSRLTPYKFCNDEPCRTWRFHAMAFGVTQGRPVNAEEQAVIDRRNKAPKEMFDRYNHSDRGRANRKRWKTENPDKVAANAERYRLSPAGKRWALMNRDRQAERTKEWRQTPAGIEAHRRYREKIADARHVAYLRRDATERSNLKFRAEMYRSAVARADSELLELIESQRIEGNSERVRRQPGDPYMMFSLDAPVPGSDDLTLGDLIPGSNGAPYLTEWSDPTAFTAIKLLEGSAS